MEYVFEGMDGTGKSSTIQLLKEKHPELKIHDRDMVSKLSLTHWEAWPEKLEDNKVYLLFEADIDVLRSRILKRYNNDESKVDEYETVEGLFLYRHIYRTLAGFYGMHLVDTTKMTVAEQCVVCEEIIYKSEKKYLVPAIDRLDEKTINSLPLVIEGESKIVRRYSSRFDIIQLKPSIYSHKMQRAGSVKGSDDERMAMTRCTLNLLARSQIYHTYYYIGKKYILADVINNKVEVPPVEVIVKKIYVGTDKHRYFNLHTIINRFGKPIVQEQKHNEYQKWMVRFDFRNPNHHPVTKEPIGDYAMCDDLADELIDTKCAKALAMRAFDCLNSHFLKFNVYLEDICFMITVEGKRLYGEISQDCGRYKQIDESKLSDLDKDIWRAGGSSELVIEKYKKMTSLITDYMKTLYKYK
jgi:phosphoribosylaminoimidazole-succinocarboxamide synthase